MDRNKSQRLVQMLLLMSRRGGVRAAELRDRFELDPRSLRRYLQDLRDLDVPYRDEGRGDARVLEVEEGFRRAGLQLTVAEVLSLTFGRRLFTFLDGTQFASDLDDALDRLEPAIPRELSELARRLDRTFFAVPEPAKDYAGERSEIIDELMTALVRGHGVRVRYRKTSGLETTYRLHPYTLATFRQALYVFALDTRAEQVKTFALERITELERDRFDRFEVPDPWDPGAYLQHAFGIISGTPARVRLAFHPELTWLITERRWHPSQALERTPDGGVILSLDVAVTVELVTWILGFADQVRVLEPSHLASLVADRLRRAAAAYEPEG